MSALLVMQPILMTALVSPVTSHWLIVTPVTSTEEVKPNEVTRFKLTSQKVV